jgi:hypothetical protein
VETVTPGAAFSDDLGRVRNNSSAPCTPPVMQGIAAADVSTGEFR